MTGAACQSVNGGRSVDEGNAVTVRCLGQSRTTFRTTLQHSVPSGRPPQVLKQPQVGESEAEWTSSPVSTALGTHNAGRSIEPPKPSLNYRTPLLSATPLVPECWKQPLRSAQAHFRDMCCMPLTDHELPAAFSVHCSAVVSKYPLSVRPQRL
jgi:hypothetical protein